MKGKISLSLVLMLCFVLLIPSMNVYAGPPCTNVASCNGTVDNADAEKGIKLCKSCQRAEGLISETVGALFSTGNSGVERTAETVYKDSGLVSSFKNVEYYDVAIPYQLTCEEIGGQSVNMSDSLKKSNVGKQIAREWSFSTCKNKSNICYNATVGKAASTETTEEGMEVIVDGNGIRYYVMAVQGFFFANSNAENFPAFSSESFGQIIDVILTDGTCIHFIYGDSNANKHTNGGENGGSNYAALNKPLYKNLFSYINANCPEIWATENSSVSWFRDTYGLSKNVSIAYYRMYNASLGDTLEVTSEDAKNVSWKMAVSGSSEVAKEINEENGAVNVGGVYSEEQLAAWTTLTEANIQADYLDDATRDSLKQDDLSNLSNWEQNINNNKMENGAIALLRKFVMLLGILIIIWSVLLYLAYWFDRINNFFYIDLLNIMTFGHLHMSDTEEECTFKVKDLGKDGRKTVNHRAIITICLTAIAFGVLLISGWLYELIANLVLSITTFLSD